MGVMETVKKPVRWVTRHGFARGLIKKAERKGDPQGILFARAASMKQDELASLFREMREQDALIQGPFSSVATSHAAVKDVLTSNDFRAGFDTGQKTIVGRVSDWSRGNAVSAVEPPSLLVTEPPDHTRYRKLVTRVFTVRAVEALRESAEMVTADLLDSIKDKESVDVVEAFCSRLPVTMISEVLGVPERDRERVFELGTAAAPTLDAGLSWRDFSKADNAMEAFDAWLKSHLTWLRANPGDNLMSRLIVASDEEHLLDDRELRSVAGLVLGAGFETTVNLLSNGIALLCQYPDQLAKLQADPSLWPNAVDEVLRFDPPVLMTARMTLRETKVANTDIAGSRFVTTVLAAANRDPEVFEEPDTFDVSRSNAGEHVSFSMGRHYCLGASLAKMEGEVGLKAFFDRFPDASMLPGAHRRPTRILRGYEILPVAL